MSQNFYASDYWHDTRNGQMLWSLRRVIAFATTVSTKSGQYDFPHISYIPVSDYKDEWDGWYCGWRFGETAVMEVEYSRVDGVFTVWADANVNDDDAERFMYIFRDKFLKGESDLEARFQNGSGDDPNEASWSQLGEAIEACVSFAKKYSTQLTPEVQERSLQSVFGLI